jgi:hypothetical protein
LSLAFLFHPALLRLLILRFRLGLSVGTLPGTAFGIFNLLGEAALHRNTL